MITSEGGILVKSHRALRCDAATSYRMNPPQRSRSQTPIEPHPVVHNTTNFATAVEVVDETCGTVHGGVEWNVKLSRARHCQVLALPLTHSPEGGSQWCQITPGVPTPRLPGVCGCTCDWSVLRSHRCNVGGCCVAVAKPAGHAAHTHRQVHVEVGNELERVISTAR